MFSVAQFLQTSTTEANATEAILVPENDDGYIAVAKAPTEKSVRPYEAAGVHPNGTPKQIIMDVVWEIEDAQLQEITKRQISTVKQGIFIELAETGAIATGEGVNDALGRVREVLGQNRPGEQWTPMMLGGQVGRIFVVHKFTKDGVPIANVKDVKAAA
jgi:hypothetical protein